MNGQAETTGTHRGNQSGVEAAQASGMESGAESTGQVPDGLRVHASVRPNADSNVNSTSPVGHTGDASQGNHGTSVVPDVGPLVTIKLTPVWYAVLLQVFDQAQYVSTPWLPQSNIRQLQKMIYEQGGTKLIEEAPRTPARRPDTALPRKKFLGIF